MESFDQVVAAQRQALRAQQQKEAAQAGAYSQDRMRKETELAREESVRAELSEAVRVEATLVATALRGIHESPDLLTAALEDDFMNARRRAQRTIDWAGMAPSAEARKAQSQRIERRFSRFLRPHSFQVWDLQDQTTHREQEEPWGATTTWRYLGRDGRIYTANSHSSPLSVSWDLSYEQSAERLQAVRNGLGLLVVRHNIELA